MSKNNKETWNTRHGPRRVRHELPTLEEAIAAAQGLSDDLDEQAAIAASLMGLPPVEVRTALLKLAPPRREAVNSVVFTGSPSAPRTIVVERKSVRRLASAANRSGQPAANSPRGVFVASNR